MSFPTKDGKWGNYNNSDGKWNGIIGELASGRADVAASSMAISLKRSTVVDFTLPIYRTNYVMIVKRGRMEPSFSFFLKPLSLEAWMCVHGLILVSTLVFFVSFKISRDKVFTRFSLLNSLTFCFGAFAGFSIRRWDKTPVSNSGRYIGKSILIIAKLKPDI